MTAYTSRPTSRIDRRTFLGRAGILAGSLAVLGLPKSAPAQDATPVGWVEVDHRITVNDVELYVAERGDPLGDPVLLLHGGLGNSGNWSFVWPHLADAGYHVILMDSRSQGRSGWSEEPITFELMAADVVGVLASLAIERTDLVGWSDGAIVSLLLAMNDSERLRRVVAYGVNFTPDGIIMPSSGPEFDTLVAQLAFEYQQLSPQPERFEELFMQFGALYAVAPNFTEEQLETIDSPILVLAGEHDELVLPDQPVELAEMIPNAELMIMKGAGHFAPIEQPAEFSEIVLTFLQGETVGTPTA